MSESYFLKLKMVTIKKNYPLKGIVQIGIAKMVASSPENQQKIIDDASYVLSMITGQNQLLLS